MPGWRVNEGCMPGTDLSPRAPVKAASLAFLPTFRKAGHFIRSTMWHLVSWGTEGQDRHVNRV